MVFLHSYFSLHRNRYICTKNILYVSVSCSVISNSLRPHGLQPTRLLCPWDSTGKNTVVGSHSLLERIFLTQGSNPGLLHLRQIIYHLSYREVLLLEISLINLFRVFIRHFSMEIYFKVQCQEMICLPQKANAFFFSPAPPTMKIR